MRLMQMSVMCVKEATGIAKEHSINKIPIVMIAGKFKIMRSGHHLGLCNSSLIVWVEGGGECGVDCIWRY